jgi:hypothetical protein
MNKDRYYNANTLWNTCEDSGTGRHGANVVNTNDVTCRYCGTAIRYLSFTDYGRAGGWVTA